jgi:hypothetical protein
MFAATCKLVTRLEMWYQPLNNGGTKTIYESFTEDENRHD